MRTHIRSIVSLLVLLIPLTLPAQYERPGSATAQFLKIGVSPRGTAMGNAFIAVVDGAEGTYYNPAVLARQEGMDAAFSHTNWFAGITHNFAAVSYQAGRIGGFGLSVTSLTTDEVHVRTPLQPEGNGETFYASNTRFGVTYSRVLTDHVSFGGTLNLIRLDLFGDYEEYAYAGDIAALYITSFREFQFGMKIANFGSSVTFVNEQYPLPLNFTFGLSINAVETPTSKLKVSGAAMKPNDGQTLAQVGAEWAFQSLLFLRGGYKLNHDIARLSGGGGVRVTLGVYDVGFDYALSQFGALGVAHRFGVRLTF